jgi:AcrR family transcriptional regulator
MTRRRRTAAEARQEILDAAERLFLRHGPEGVRVAKVAKEVGISHPGVLHHFRTADLMVAELHRKVSVRIRTQVLGLLSDDGPGGRAGAVLGALKALADPGKGRLLAWVVASGKDPFPPREELGLRGVAARLQGVEEPSEEACFAVQLAVLAMLGDSMLGEEVRARLGLDESSAPRFRRWLATLLMR